MPRVPDYSSRQVASRPIPVPTLSGRGPDASGLIRGIEQVESGVMRIVEQEREKADTASTMAFDSQLSEYKFKTFFNPESGVYSKKAGNALNITNQVIDGYDQFVGEQINSLPNERVKARAKKIAEDQRTSWLGELNRYEYGERQTHYANEYKGQVAAAIEGAALYANDPDQRTYYQNKLNVVEGAEAVRLGLPPELAEQQRLKSNSTLSMAVIGRLATNDPFRAQDYYARNAFSMTAEDQLQASKLLGTSVRKTMANDIAGGLWRGDTASMSGLTAAVIQAESAGDSTAVSPKGARGLMQLMPETAKEMSVELGIPYSEERLTADPNYNMTLGKAYLEKMLKRYDGNEALAVAAYNAGPGAVDSWIKDYGDPRQDVAVTDWLNSIPYPETRNYTAKVLGATAPRMPASARYSDALSAVEKIADPELRQLTKDRLDDFKKAQDAEQKALYDQAAQLVYDRGFNELSPQLIDRLSPDDLVKLRKQDRYKREGTEPVTDYSKLQELISMPPAQLSELSLERDIRPYLNNSDFNRVLTAYTKAANGDTSGQGSLKSEENALAQVMAMAGIATGNTKEAKTPKNLERQQQFRAAYQARKDAIFEATGKWPTAHEAQEISQQLLLDVRLAGTGTFSDDSRQLWEVAPEELSQAYLDRGDIALADIPPAERLRIVQTLRANGQSASEENIVAQYIEKISGLGVSVR